MPLPATRMVPDDWQQRHAATIRVTMRSTVQVVRRADRVGTRDATVGRTSWATPYIVYEGAARVQSRSAVNTRFADRQAAVGDYLVAVPADAAAVKVDDVVEVTSCPDSPALTDLTLVVRDCPQADVAWQRNLLCDLVEPSARG